MKKIIFLILLFCLPVSVNAVSEEVYDEYQTFMDTYFSSRDENLVYEKYGANLQLIEDDSWSYISENSAVFAFETNIPAIVEIEYSTNSDLNFVSEADDRHYFNHVVYLKNLNKNTTYFYRIKARSESGQIIYSAKRQFQTVEISDAIHIPGDMGEAPYILDQANAVYILDEDIIADTRAFSFWAEGITLDLNGHKVIYDNATSLVSGSWNDYVYSNDSSFGVANKLWGRFADLRLLNGFIEQGANGGQGSISYGFNPVYISGGDIEIAGLSLEYHGHSVGGIIKRDGDSHIHHNVILDKGTGIDNRHQGIKAIEVGEPTIGVHHNLIKRSRHQAIKGGGDKYGNEIYQDSYDSNGFAIVTGDENKIYNNKIYGTGYHVVGVSWGTENEVYNNLIYLIAREPLSRSSEYGDMSSVSALRLTQYGGATKAYENNKYYDNTVIVKAMRGGNTARGFWFFSDPYVKNLQIYNNVVKAENLDEESTAAGCVFPQGLRDRADTQEPVYYTNNTFIANRAHIVFGDSYGGGGNHIFRNNKYEKIGSRSDYRTIEMGYWVIDMYKNRFIDSDLGLGTSLSSPVFSGSGLRDYSLGHSLYLRLKNEEGTSLASKEVRLFDSSGENYLVESDESGKVRLEILEETYRAESGETNYSLINHSGHYLQIAGYEDYILDAEILELKNNQDVVVDLILKSDGSVAVNTENRADTDGDKKITVKDALLSLRKYFGLSMLESSWQDFQNVADVNCDGILNKEDITLTLKYTLGFDTSKTSWCVQ